MLQPSNHLSISLCSIPCSHVSQQRICNSELASEKAGNTSYALELSQNRRATVSTYMNEPRVDLREYYEVSV